MLKIFRKNVSLGIFVVAICSFLQVAGANANFKREYSQQASFVSMIVQESIKPVDMTVANALDESIEQTEGFVITNVHRASLTVVIACGVISGLLSSLLWEAINYIWTILKR
ncbi:MULTISPECIES: hypothetical protein [unclassified Bartonella]|uniref:hypothetical protein n=1 Tax=unclassified Bartonella TaxID=2645622 RepID=UPI00300E3324